MSTTFRDGKGLVLRKEKTTLVDAWQDIFENQVLGLDHPALATGGKGVNRDRYKHPRLGGEVVLGGMDRPLKLFSTNYDWIYVNECQELTKNEWESLIRATFGRTSSVPFRILWGDCNPAEKTHWANRRCLDGVAHRIRGRFWDNPMLFDHEKFEEGLSRGLNAQAWSEECWTEAGKATLLRFSRTMTGHRKRRLFYGEWVSAEGAVWPMWDDHIHVISAELGSDQRGKFLEVPEWGTVRLGWFIGSHDIGLRNPACAQVWGVDDLGIAYLVAEHYRRGLNHEEWADIWHGLSKEFPLSAVVTDHDPAFQSLLNRKIVRKGKDGLPLFRNWDKKHRGPQANKAGIDEVAARLQPQGHGQRGLYLVRKCLRHAPDPELEDAGSPTSTRGELESYIWTEQVSEDRPAREEPRKVDDHGCDALKGAMLFLSAHDWSTRPGARPLPEGTWGRLAGHEKLLRN